MNTCQLHYKSSGKKYFVGVTTTTYHTTPSYTHHIAIFAVFDCFYLFGDPYSRQIISCNFKKFTARKEIFVLSFCTQSRFIILHTSDVVLKKRSFQRCHFCRRYGFGRVPIWLDICFRIHTYLDQTPKNHHLKKKNGKKEKY